MASKEERENQEKKTRAAQEEAKARKTVKQEMSEEAKLLREIKGYQQDIAESVKERIRFAGDDRDLASKISTLQKEIAKDAGVAQEYAFKAAAGQKLSARELKTFKVAQLRAETNLSSLRDLQAEAQDRILKSTEETNEVLDSTVESLYDAEENVKQIGEGFEKIKKSNDDLNNKTKFFDSLADLTSSIPILGPFFSSIQEGAQAFREALTEGDDFKAFTAGAEAFGDSIGKLTATLGVGIIAKGIGEGQNRITDFARTLNYSREEAAELNKELATAAASMPGLSAGDLADSITTVSNELGITADLSMRSARSLGVMSKYLGLSAEESSRLAVAAAGTGQDIATLSDNLLGTVVSQNAATDSAVRYQDVFKDVAETSAATQLTVSKFPGGIAQAAYQARKLGLTLSGLENSASSLLDFESSIEAELEAELLTGRELNLERARAAALMGDQTTLAQELAKNFGTAKDFSEQSVIAQEAQAKAMGMTRDQLAETLMRQEAMDRFGVSTNEELQKRIRLGQEHIKDLERQGKFEDANLARQELYAKIGNEELIRQEQNRSVQEKLALAMQSFADAASKAAPIIDGIGNAFDKLAKAPEAFFAFFTKAYAKIRDLGKTLGIIGLSIDNTKNTLRSILDPVGLFKGAGKITTKTLIKKIPFLGAIAGLGLALKRFSEGDITGGLLELTSGVLSTLFPGLGTLASVGLDAYLLKRDKNRERKAQASVITDSETMTEGQKAYVGGQTTTQQLKERQDRTNQQLNQMNETLNKIANKDSNVYLDSRKTGQNLRLYTSTTG